MTSDRNPSRIVVLASLVVLFGIAACTKSSPTAPSGDGVAGTTFNLGPFALGQSIKLTFSSAGTTGYHCIPHRSMGMVGTVRVDAGGADSVVVQIGADLAFSPSTAHVKPGGYVRWVNVSGDTDHTVTSD